MRVTVACVATWVLIFGVVHPPRALAEVELGGFAQANYATRTTGEETEVAGEFPLGEERLQLKLEGYSEDGSSAYLGKLDFFHDAVLGESDLEVRETYVDLFSESFALRAGRQIITWGVGDLLFLNDVFPKDWVAFFTGRPLQYLKFGSDALKVDVYPGPFSAELVILPFFEPDRYPTGERLVLTDPLPPDLPRREEQKKRSIGNAELAGRMSFYVADWEAAVYLARTFHRTPAVAVDDPDAPTEVLFFFPRLNVYGGTITGSLKGGVLSLEGAYNDSDEDREGTDPAIENSEVKGLVGYGYPLWEDATVGLQGFLEWMLDYGAYRANLPLSVSEREEQRWTVTTRFTQLLRHQTLSVNFFGFWGVTERDAYLIPSVRFAFTDELWAEVGANVFLGNESDTMFGSLERNDNVYVTVRHGF